MTKRDELVSYLSNLKNCRDVTSVRVIINGKEIFEDCALYRDINHLDLPRIYVISPVAPKSYQKRNKVVYIEPGRNVAAYDPDGWTEATEEQKTTAQWFIGGYIWKIEPQYAEFHPFGPWFGLHIWPEGYIGSIRRQHEGNPKLYIFKAIDYGEWWGGKPVIYDRLPIRVEEV